MAFTRHVYAYGMFSLIKLNFLIKNFFQVTEADKNFRSSLHSQEEEGSCLKDGGAHTEE